MNLTLVLFLVVSTVSPIPSEDLNHEAKSYKDMIKSKGPLSLVNDTVEYEHVKEEDHKRKKRFPEDRKMHSSNPGVGEALEKWWSKYKKMSKRSPKSVNPFKDCCFL